MASGKITGHIMEFISPQSTMSHSAVSPVLRTAGANQRRAGGAHRHQQHAVVELEQQRNAHQPPHERAKPVRRHQHRAHRFGEAHRGIDGRRLLAKQYQGVVGGHIQPLHQALGERLKAA